MAKNLFDFGNENIESSCSTNENNNSNINNSSTYNKNNQENYSNFSSQNYNSQNLKDYNNSTQGIEQEAKNLYDKYKDYSQNDLISEFLSNSKQKLKEGSLTQDKINSTANALLPYLNEEQREMMSRLLERLND